MPYIEQGQRDHIKELVDGLAVSIQEVDGNRLHAVDRAGILNYAITRLCLGVFPQRKYWVLALVVGILVTATLEYYRRWVAPYENKKITENGDVYPSDAEGGGSSDLRST